MARKRSKAMRATIPSKSDDLTLVKGIGPAIVARLRDANIETYSQLAILTPEELSARVVGISARRIARERWIKQAQKLAVKEETGVPPRSEIDREPRQHYATFTIELLLDKENFVRRTRVTYVQNNSEESWAGWSELKLVSFVNKCAGLYIPQPDNILLSTRSSDTSLKEILPDPEIRCQLSGTLRIFELIVTSKDSDIPQLLVHTDEAFSVHILLDITEVKTPPSTPINCAVTIWAKKLGTGVRQMIGERQSTFTPVDKVPCVVKCMIPSQGTYRLEAMATISPTSTSSPLHRTIRAWQEGGLLQVV